MIQAASPFLVHEYLAFLTMPSRFLSGDLSRSPILWGNGYSSASGSVSHLVIDFISDAKSSSLPKYYIGVILFGAL